MAAAKKWTSTKKAFILKQSAKIHAREVVKAARKVGLQISENHVHVERSKARRAKREAAEKAARRAKRKK